MSRAEVDAGLKQSAQAVDATRVHLFERHRTTLRFAAGVFACLALGFYPFVRGTTVPLLGWVDLGFHELGHLLMYLVPVGDVLTALMGSVMQVAVPAGLAVYFGFARRDLLGVALCSGWTGTSLHNVGVYVADAPVQALPLIGGTHDWAFLLGPRGFDVLAASGTIARAISAIGAVAVLAGLAISLGGPWLEERLHRPGAEQAPPARDPRWTWHLSSPADPAAGGGGTDH